MPTHVLQRAVITVQSVLADSCWCKCTLFIYSINNKTCCLGFGICGFTPLALRNEKTMSYAVSTAAIYHLKIFSGLGQSV